ncbi:unnamed protein product [Withania somnifera]
MLREGISRIPSSVSASMVGCALLEACELGAQLHALSWKVGFALNVVIGTVLMDMYFFVFWNAKRGYLSDPSSVSASMVGCALLEACELGAQLHTLSWKVGFALNVVVGTVLMDMYLKCLDLETSRRRFDQMNERNVVTWTFMITAMVLFKEMLKLGTKVNCVTYTSLLSSFSCSDFLVRCDQVHCHVIQQCFNTNHYLVTSLLSAYAECSCSLVDFRKLCSNVVKWDEISWNAVISGFSNLVFGGEAFSCFSRMRRAGLTIDHYTSASILKAIGCISGLEEGMRTHCLALETGLIFSSIEERDLLSWNSLLTGCAHHGYGGDVIVMFEKMRRYGIKPDPTTFLAVLSSCRHAGLLDEGLKYFYLMKNGNSLPPPKLEHYACIVDLYGLAGHLREAKAFIDNMPIEPGPSVYKSLLNACQPHGFKGLAVISAKKLVELCPNDPATYVLLANMLASEANWNDAEGQRKLLLDRGS